MEVQVVFKIVCIFRRCFNYFIFGPAINTDPVSKIMSILLLYLVKLDAVLAS